MTTTQTLAVLLLAAPALAAAAPHTVAVRVAHRSLSYSRVSPAADNVQTNFVGKVNGKSMIVNAVVSPKGGAFLLGYQIEVSEPDKSRSFQAQGSIVLSPGDRVAAVECGDWKLFIAFDAGKADGAAQAWNPGGPNHRVTTTAWKRSCRIVQKAGTQSNVVDNWRSGGRSTGLIYNIMVDEPDGNACKVHYQVENSLDTPSRQTMGDEDIVLGRTTATKEGPYEIVAGKKAAHRTGQVIILVEGTAKASSTPASRAAAVMGGPSEDSGASVGGQGSVPLLR